MPLRQPYSCSTLNLAGYTVVFEVLCLELLRFENRNLFGRKWCARLWLQGISKFQAGTYLTISYVEKYAFVS